MKVQALQSFEHGGSRRRHDIFEVSDNIGQALVRKGLVKMVEQNAEAGGAEPQPAAPKPSGRAKNTAKGQ